MGPNQRAACEGYYLLLGFSSWDYHAKFYVGSETSFVVTGLRSGARVCFAVIAYDSPKLVESSLSNEVAFSTAVAELVVDFGDAGLGRYERGRWQVVPRVSDRPPEPSESSCRGGRLALISAPAPVSAVTTGRGGPAGSLR